MKIKHKVIKEFQYLSPDKKIFVLKAGTVLEAYNYRVKAEVIPIDKEIIDNNPEFFEVIDWKAELMSYMKINKMPQPAQLGKKLIPFIEDMVLSSIQVAPAGPAIDESKIKEVERKEIDLNSREKRIKEKEEEIEIRLKRVEKREGEYKEDLKSLDKKEDELREKQLEIIEKGLDLDDKMQDLNEKERNLDRAALESSKEIDEKYVKLQKKIDEDLKSLAEKERQLEKKSKDLAKKESELSSSESGSGELSKKIEGMEDAFEDIMEKTLSMDSTIRLLNDFNTRPFTMEYLQSIFADLSSRSSEIKEMIRKI